MPTAPTTRAIGADLATPAFTVCSAGAEGLVPVGATGLVSLPAGKGASGVADGATGATGLDWRVVGIGATGEEFSGAGAGADASGAGCSGEAGVSGDGAGASG